MTHNFNCGCQHTHQSRRCSPTRARERPSRSNASRQPALHIVVPAQPSVVAQRSLTHLGGKVLVSAIVGTSPNLNSLRDYVPPEVLVVPRSHPIPCHKPQAQCKDDSCEPVKRSMDAPLFPKVEEQLPRPTGKPCTKKVQPLPQLWQSHATNVTC